MRMHWQIGKRLIYAGQKSYYQNSGDAMFWRQNIQKCDYCILTLWNRYFMDGYIWLICENL
jgi:hypothetical protein